MPALCVLSLRFHLFEDEVVAFRTVQKSGFSSHLCLPGGFQQREKQRRPLRLPREAIYPFGGTRENLHGLRA